MNPRSWQNFIPPTMLGWVLLVGAFFAPSPVMGQIRYTIQWLGDLPGGEFSSRANAINEQGQVVGRASGESGFQAVLWENGSIVDIGSLVDSDSSVAKDINDIGGVIGSGGPTASFLWDQTDGVRDLGTPPGSPSDRFFGNSAINNANQVTGREYLIDDGLWTDLGRLPSAVEQRTFARDINDLTQIVGSSLSDVTGDNLFRAFLWEDGSISDLGDPPDTKGGAGARAINNQGVIVGVSDGGNAPGLGGKATVWDHGQISVLPALPGDQRAGAFSINNPGQIVGRSILLGARISRANFDGSGFEELITTGLTDPKGIELDVASGKMYWVDAEAQKVQRANLNGTNIEDLVDVGGRSVPWGIALDISDGKVYWTDTGLKGRGRIQRASLDGSDAEDLVTGLDGPVDISLDPANGKMYWLDTAFPLRSGTIQRADLDGTNVETVLSLGNFSGSLAIDLDLVNEKIYWMTEDFSLATISRANLDGSDVEVVTTDVSFPNGIAVDGQAISSFGLTVVRTKYRDPTSTRRSSKTLFHRASILRDASPWILSAKQSIGPMKTRAYSSHALFCGKTTRC